MRVLSIIGLFLFSSMVYGAGKGEVSLEITQEMVNQCYRDLIDHGYSIKQERLYKGDEQISVLQPELGLVSPKCKDPYWAERAKRAKRTNQFDLVEKNRMLHMVAGLFKDGRLTVCENCMANVSLTKDDLLQHTAVQCLEKDNYDKQCKCVKEFHVSPDMKVLRHMSDMAGALRMTEVVESYQFAKSLLDNKAPEMSKKFLTCKLENVLDSDCPQFLVVAKAMKEYKKQYPSNKHFKLWMDKFKGDDTWKKFTKKLLRKYEIKKGRYKLYSKMATDGKEMCNKDKKCISRLAAYQQSVIESNTMLDRTSFYVATRLDKMCHYIKKSKDKFCKGELVLSTHDELYFDNNDFVKKLTMLSASCHNFLKDSNSTDAGYNALAKLVKDTSEYREHSLPGALDSLEKLVDPNGVEVSNDDLAEKTLTETLKNSFQDFVTPKGQQQRVMQEVNPFDQVSYNSALDNQQDEESKKIKAKKASQQRELTEQERRIQELEKKLAAKAIQQKATTQVTEKNKISSEIEKLLAELKAVKAENAKLRNKEMEKVVAPSVVAPTNNATVINSNPTHTNLDTVPNSQSSTTSNNAVHPIANGGAGGIATSSDNTVASTGGDTISKGQDSGESSASSSMFNGASLLTFSYAEFTKMDKSILYKESNGKPIEIIKKDEHGNPVIYILEPIVNEKGEFVDYRMVKKDKLKGKMKEKVVVKQKSEKDLAKEDSAKKSRAWYKKLLDVFKQKLQGL